MSEKTPPKDEESPVPVDQDGDSPGESAEEQAFFEGKSMDELRAEALRAEGFEPDEDEDDGDEPRVEGEDELQRIMSPAKSARHPILASAVIVACLFGLWWLWDDFRFFLRGRTPENLGPAIEAVKNKKLRHNTYVSLEGSPLPQSMGSGKLRSWLGGGTGQRTQWFLLAGTNYQVVIRTKTTEKRRSRGTFRGSYTGRLRRLSSTRSDKQVRRFYLETSRRSIMLRPNHQVAGTELLSKVGRGSARLKDLKGRTFDVHGDSVFDIFVAFPGEYEFSLHTDHVAELKEAEVRGGQGAPKVVAAKPKGAKKPATPAGGKRPAGWGGAVLLKLDPGTFSLAALTKAGALQAPDGKPPAEAGQPPTSGEDLVVPIPLHSEVYNVVKRDCKKACRWRGEECKKHCAQEKQSLIPPENKHVFVAAGGDSPSQKGEVHKIYVKASPFRDVKLATGYMASLGHPFILAEDLSKTVRMVKFIVRLPDAVAQRLIKQQTRRSPYNISTREEVYRVRWRHLKRRGGQLLINRTSRGFPRQFVVDPKTKRLRPVVLGPTLVIAAPRVIKADISRLLKLPEDTYVLEEGVKPGSMWFEPFPPGIPVIYLLLLGFIVFNLLAIRAHFRG